MLRTRHAVICLVVATTTATAEGFPVRDRSQGREAALYGYTRSGNSFLPTSDRSRPAIPRRHGEACPYGYTGSGGACVSVR